ncbi:LolA-related protein [Asaia astilbis]|uniref:LolA-related protein n=1 Tax=Asaia astilbis TaxID=610244 RepID=UPI000472CEC8|nr:LolA-related protein [Asaia astilbis]
MRFPKLTPAFIVCTSLAWSLSCSGPASAGMRAQYGLNDLMQDLAQVKMADGQFEEIRQSKLLASPVKSSGTLHYSAPDFMQKTVQAPEKQDFILKGNEATLVMQGKTRHFSTGQAPQLAGLVNGMRATLAGDGSTLDRLYETRFSGTRNEWQLLLIPRDAKLRQFLSWITVSGSDAIIEKIVSVSASGDLSTMTVKENVTLAR